MSWLLLDESHAIRMSDVQEIEISKETKSLSIHTSFECYKLYSQAYQERVVAQLFVGKHLEEFIQTIRKMHHNE